MLLAATRQQPAKTLPLEINAEEDQEWGKLYDITDINS